MNLFHESIEVINAYKIEIVIGWINNLALIANQHVIRDTRYIANQGERSPNSISFSIFKPVIRKRLSFFDAVKILKALRNYLYM